MSETVGKYRATPMKIISAISQRGGCGKTTTTLCLAQGLAKRGKKVLVVDLDSQRNSTHALKGEHIEGRNSMTVLVGMPPEMCIQKVGENIHLIPSALELKDFAEVLGNTGGQYKLKKALESVKYDFDYCLLDTAPSLTQITINVLTASDSVIVPVLCDIFSFQGLLTLIEIINEVKGSYNPDLVVEGVLLTQYNGRTSLTQEMIGLLEEAAEKMDSKVFDTKIRVNQKIKDSQALQMNLFDYAPTCHGAEDYNALINEIIGE